MPTFEASRDPYPTPERVAVIEAAIALGHMAAAADVPSHVIARVVGLVDQPIDLGFDSWACDICNELVAHEASLCAACADEYCVVCEAPLSIVAAGGACNRCLDEFFATAAKTPASTTD